MWRERGLLFVALCCIGGAWGLGVVEVRVRVGIDVLGVVE